LIALSAVGLLAPQFLIDENHRPFHTSDSIHLVIAAGTFILAVIAISSSTTVLAGLGALSLPDAAQTLSALTFDSLVALAICFFFHLSGA
jgi:hypothetical protein